MGFHWLSTGFAGAFQAALLAAAAGFVLALGTHALAPRLHWRTGSALGVAMALGLLVGAGVDAWHLFHLSIVRLESPFAIRETLARIHDPDSLGLRVAFEMVGACSGALAGWGVWDLLARRRR